jgi:transposase
LAAGLGNGAPNPVLAAKRLLEPAAKLARFGYSRDGRRERPQIVIGLLCAADGCPVAVAVFEGDVADPLTLGAQIAKLKKRFRLRRVVLSATAGW